MNSIKLIIFRVLIISIGRISFFNVLIRKLIVFFIIKKSKKPYNASSSFFYYSDLFKS